MSPTIGSSFSHHFCPPWSLFPSQVIVLTGPMHESLYCCRQQACVQSYFNCNGLFVTPWTAAHQPPLSMGFARQEYWSGVPLPSLVQCYRHMLIFPKTPFRTQAMMVSSFFVFNDRFLVTVIDSPLFSICTTSCVLASTKILLTFVNFL